MISGNQVWSKDIINAFPRVVSRGITLPLDKVLKGLSPSYTSVAEYRFNLEVFLSFDKVRWGSVEVGTVCFCLSIRAKE